MPVDKNSRPLQDAVISNCGELVKVSKSEYFFIQLFLWNKMDTDFTGKKEKKKKRKAEASEESGSEDEREKKKKDKKKKKKRSRE